MEPCIRKVLQAAARLNRRWLTTTVLPLVRLIERNRHHDPLPILANAQEDTGCDDAAIVDHCRVPSPQGPECWILAALCAPLESFGPIRRPVGAE